jgi:hypothetical protein
MSSPADYSTWGDWKGKEVSNTGNQGVGMLQAVGPEHPFIDGYGVPFNPQVHWDAIKAALDAHRAEQEEKAKNPPPVIEVPLKEKPAGWYQREVKNQG